MRIRIRRRRTLVNRVDAGHGELRSAPIVRRDWLDHCRRFARHALLFTCLAACSAAQELQPRAYLPAPVGLNYFGISYANNRGGLLVDPGLALEDVRFRRTRLHSRLRADIGTGGAHCAVVGLRAICRGGRRVESGRHADPDPLFRARRRDPSIRNENSTARRRWTSRSSGPTVRRRSSEPASRWRLRQGSTTLIELSISD